MLGRRCAYALLTHRAIGAVAMFVYGGRIALHSTIIRPVYVLAIYLECVRMP
jgi:hypothetical protein